MTFLGPAIVRANQGQGRHVEARTNSMRLWQSRTCATFTVTVAPFSRTIS